MTSNKVPGVKIRGTVNRALLLLVAILVGVIIACSTADAAVKIEKRSYNKSAQKKKNRNYSCSALMKKQRNSSNTVVKTNARRPKWR